VTYFAMSKAAAGCAGKLAGRTTTIDNSIARKTRTAALSLTDRWTSADGTRVYGKARDIATVDRRPARRLLPSQWSEDGPDDKASHVRARCVRSGAGRPAAWWYVSSPRISVEVWRPERLLGSTGIA